MDIHEPSADVLEYSVTDLSDELLYSLFSGACERTGLDDSIEEFVEVVEWELVHAVNVGQVSHYKVQNGPSQGHCLVTAPGQVYHHLFLFCLL